MRGGRVTPRPSASNSAAGEAAFAPLLKKQQLAEPDASLPGAGPLRKLFQQTEEDAAELRQKFSTQALAQYRRSLAAFIQQVVASGLEVDFQTSRISLLARSRKRYTILRLVEQQSLELAAMAVNRQFDEMALLAKINRIRGLLIDLLS